MNIQEFNQKILALNNKIFAATSEQQLERIEVEVIGLENLPIDTKEQEKLIDKCSDYLKNFFDNWNINKVKVSDVVYAYNFFNDLKKDKGTIDNLVDEKIKSIAMLKKNIEAAKETLLKKKSERKS